ncbi:cyanophycinase [Roseateles sp.]|uniref:cyanophycinase n=1 Tax=Roseateles sp. TaxID=1971397 RepID=UPI0031CEABB4
MHPSRSSIRRALALLALTAAASTAQAQTAIVIGGALKFDNDAVWQRIVDEAGGRRARFAVFATAAANPERAAAQIVEALRRRGAQAEAVPVTPRLAPDALQAAVRDPALLARVRGATGVFFSGGAQELIVDTLQPQGRPTPMLEAIWEVYRRGGVVAGTSAGAAIMSRVMFRDAQDVLGVMQGGLREGVEIDRGLGFVGPDLFIDQHFLKRGRIGRMLPLMLAKGYRAGLGVEENSAAVIHADQAEVIGARGALFVDLREARTDPRLGGFNLENARLSYLDRGDRIDLRTGAVTASAEKRASSFLDPGASDFKPYFKDEPFYADILGDNTIAQAMAQLLDGQAAELRGLAARLKPRLDGPPGRDAPTAFEFRLYKGADTRGWFTGAFGGEDYTVVNVHLDVRPARVASPLYEPIAPVLDAPPAPSAGER